MKYAIIAGIAIIGIFLTILSQIPLGIEPLTELYFENHTKLPVHIFPMKYYNFTFTARNLEEQTMLYTYNVTILDNEGETKRVLDTGEFTLENNETFTKFERFFLEQKFQRAKILVRIEKNYSLENPEFRQKLWWGIDEVNTIDIHFWVEEIQGVTITITDD